MIRAIVTDLDGTMLHGADHNSYDHNLLAQVISKLKVSDGYFLIASGREPIFIQEHFAEFIDLPNFGIIANNGANIMIANQMIQSITIDDDQIKKIWDFFETYDNPPTGGMFYSSEDTIFIPKKFVNQEKLDKLQLKAKVVQIDSIDEIKGHIFKIVGAWDADIHEQLQTDLGPEFATKIHVTTSGYGSIDIVAGGVNKAEGLKVFSEKYSVPASEMAAFGDGGNDLEMLAYVGHPFVMPNADSAKMFEFGYPLADDTNENNGVTKTSLRILEGNI